MRHHLIALACFGLASAIAHAQTTSLVSRAADGTPADFDSLRADVSSNGRFIVFESYAGNLVPGDDAIGTDYFLLDRTLGTLTAVTVDMNGLPGNDGIAGASVSDDGRFVAFGSVGDDLVVGDDNGACDVFLRDLQAGTTTLVSVDRRGGSADGISWFPSISGDGRVVAFESMATDLVAGDLNAVSDAFVRDLVAGTTTCASRKPGGAFGNGPSTQAVISADGGSVAFTSVASNLVVFDGNGSADVIVLDLASGALERVTVSSGGSEADVGGSSASISGDGRLVTFLSWATNLSDADGVDADVFLRDRTARTTELVSVALDGALSDGNSYFSAVSDDGRFVAFESFASNLVNGGLPGGPKQIYLRDRQRGLTRMISVRNGGAPGNGPSEDPAASADGGTIVFTSWSTNLVDGVNHFLNVYAHDAPVGLAASWNNYGAGFPGTLGIPTITASADPVLATTLDVAVSNSYGRWTLGLLVVGLAPAQIPLNVGGDLLVLPLVMIPIPLVVPGIQFVTPIAYDPAFAGASIYSQALELDPGAAHGWSFTPGLELHFGF